MKTTNSIINDISEQFTYENVSWAKVEVVTPYAGGVHKVEGVAMYLNKIQKDGSIAKEYVAFDSNIDVGKSEKLIVAHPRFKKMYDLVKDLN